MPDQAAPSQICDGASQHCDRWAAGPGRLRL